VSDIQFWQNKIVGYDEVDPESLLAHDSNWRIHPAHQQEALKGALSEIGWIQDIIVNKRTSPEWGADQNVETVLDGHLRVTLALRHDQPKVPIKYVDLTPQQEALALATFDPISATAAADREKLGALLQNVQSGEAGVQALLAGLAEREGIFFASGEGGWADAMGRLPTEDRAPFQQMTFTLHDTQVETVKAALSASKGTGDFDGPNQNSNGNALARICEAYVNGQG
jgi:hypothetical protein